MHKILTKELNEMIAGMSLYGFIQLFQRHYVLYERVIIYNMIKQCI